MAVPTVYILVHNVICARCNARTRTYIDYSLLYNVRSTRSWPLYVYAYLPPVVVVVVRTDAAGINQSSSRRQLQQKGEEEEEEE